MPIIIPEKIIKEELEIIIRKYHDDLLIREALGTVTDAADVDAGVTVAVITQGAVGTAEVTDITTVADTAKSLNGTHWTLSSPSTNYYVWYNVDASGIDPTLGVSLGIEVAISEDDTAIAVAVATAAALDNFRDKFVLQVFSVPVPTTATLTITNEETDAARRSLLFQIFGGIVFDQYDYFEQFGLMLKNRYDNEQRRLEIVLGYDQNRTNFPLISIMLPSEEDQPKQTGVTGNTVNFFDGTFSRENLHAFQDTYNLLITSDNQNDVIVTYNFLKTIILTAIENFHQNGLENVWVTGRDIMMDFDLNPMSTFHRTVAISFFYQNELPEIQEDTFADTITFTGNPDQEN